MNWLRTTTTLLLDSTSLLVLPDSLSVASPFISQVTTKKLCYINVVERQHQINPVAVLVYLLPQEEIIRMVEVDTATVVVIPDILNRTLVLIFLHRLYAVHKTANYTDGLLVRSRGGENIL